MATIIPFPAQADRDPEDEAIDLITAVDAAIRDLADISRNWGSEAARRQAEDCREMLMQAFDMALADQDGRQA
jgi:hypothetical protein